MPHRYSRRISPVERLALTVNELYPYNVVGVIEGEGTIDAEKFRAASDRAAAANPAVRVRLRGWLGMARWVDSGIPPRVRVMPEADWDGASEVGAPFLQERLDALRGGPVCDIMIVPCKDGRTRLMVRALHAALDGRGAMLWGMDVVRAMRGEPLVGSTSTLTDFEVQAQHADRIVKEEPSPPVLAIPAVAPGRPDGAPLRYVWRRVLLDQNVGLLLPRTAAFLAEYARRREPGDIAFTIPVDYRGLRTQEFGIGNLTGYFRLKVPEGGDVRLLLKQMRERIQSFVDCRPVPGEKALLWTPIWYLTRRMRRNYDLLLYGLNPIFPTGGLVSMGTSTPETFSFPGFTARTIHGIPGSVGKLNVVFINGIDSASVCFAAPALYNDRGQFDEMVQAFQRQFSKVEHTS